jgi:hypothetical protein
MRALLGVRRPVVAVRLAHRNEDGSVVATIQADGQPRKAVLVKEAVERIFRHQAPTLTAREWTELFRPDTPSGHDLRWGLLARLAVVPQGDERKLRDQFVALPDGTAFGMRLLLIDTRAGGGQAVATHLPFARLPDVVKVVVLKEALLQERQDGNVRTDGALAELLVATANALGLKVGGARAATVSDLRKRLKNNNGEGILPPAKVRRRRHQEAGQAAQAREGTA